MSTSRIEWTDATWNPIVGCTRCSPACDHCYAVRMAHRLGSNPQTPQYKGLTRMTTSGPDWTGEVRCLPGELSRPLKWRESRRIFVGSMTDLFHPAVPFEFLDRIFAVMALCPQHTFQVLTKRPERMREYMGLGDRGPLEALSKEVGAKQGYLPWPLPNVWLGTTIWDQDSADRNVSVLLDTQAAVRFVSAEPMLGPVDMDKWIGSNGGVGRCDVCGQPYSEAHPTSQVHARCANQKCPRGNDGEWYASVSYRPSISWVICGGETGPGARPMHPDWVRSLRDQCKGAGVAFFFKSWGEWAPWDDDNWSIPAGADDVLAHDRAIQINGVEFLRVGKKAAGRILDGRTWEQFPEVGR